MFTFITVHFFSVSKSNLSTFLSEYITGKCVGVDWKRLQIKKMLTMEEKVKKKGGKSHGQRCIPAGSGYSNVKSAEVAMFLFPKDEDEPGWCHCFVD